MHEPVTFSLLNYIILFIYLGAMLFIGWLFAGRQKTTEDYFLAGRKMNWLVVGMSMFASLTSAVTYMGLPATAYKENISLLVVSIISPIVAPFIIFLFYPFYRRLNATTSYEYINHRFGQNARFAVSALFILARLGWLGTVIYAPALALSVVTGLSLSICILLMGLIATAYTVMGGITADIWTDVVQFIIMVGGAVWLVWSLVHAIPNGVAGILDIAKSTQHLHVFNPQLSWYEMSGYIVAITFFFQLMQDYGTDQTTVQRMMTIPTFRGIAKAISFNAVVDFLLIATLLFIGLGLLAYHITFPERLPDGIEGDRLLPFYIIHALPDGVSGLLITAIFAAAMSSMDSGISSLATVMINDFAKPLRKRPRADHEDLFTARVLTLILGVFATGVAFYVSSFEHIIKAYTSIISLFNAPILALFLLGVLSRRVQFGPWFVGALLAIASTQTLQIATKVHWIYYFPFSLTITVVVSYAGSFLRKRPLAPIEMTIWERFQKER